jgi:hypothetical protein
MPISKQFQLRVGNTIWATLHVDQDGTKRLDLDAGLTELQVQSYTGGLVAYADGSEPLSVEQGPYHVYLKDSSGNTQLSLRMGSNGEISDVEHPLVTLMVIPVGAGTMENDPISFPQLLFGLRWK